MSRASTKRLPAGRAGNKSRARKPAASRGGTPTRSDPPAGDRVRDLWGLGLLVVAALTALALYAEAAGTLGVFLDLLFRGLFGVFGLLAPLGLAAGGVTLLREPRPATVRVVTGVSVTTLACAGLWHLASGAPDFDAPVAALYRSGGWAGAALALPLEAVAATWGAVVVLVAAVALGLTLATAVPPRVVARRLATVVKSGWDRLVERRARLALVDDRERGPDDATAPLDADDPDAPLGAHDPDATAVVEGQDEADGSAGQGDRGAVARGWGSEDRALTDTQLLPRGLDTGDRPRLARSGPTDKPATALSPSEDRWAGYELPPLSLLRSGRAAPGNKRALDQMTRALEHTMHQFAVDARVSRVSRGPTVTRFEVELGPGVKVAAVTRLGDDISYALATPEIRIVAPIPGKSAIGIEVPNRDRDLITLGDVLRSPEAAVQHHLLAAGIGKDIAGNPVLVNLATMPHLLIAGATGSGKSVTMNAIVASVLMRATPAQVRMILVDPKRVELNHYDGAPHLLTPVVTDPKRATEALAWTVKEMEDRYERLALLGYRNVDTYNQAAREGTLRTAPVLSGRADETFQALPYVLVVVDELADLMMVAPRDVESAIVRIAQMARAVGIHLVVATQRPSVDVVTGLIKANIPSRIALAMATQADSRTILDQAGAEKLVGHGDMLLLPANASKPHRIQGCYIDEGEIEQVVAFCKGQRVAEYARGVVREGEDAATADLTRDDASDTDLVRAAMELVVRSGLGSTSMLQRKLKVGFARAGRLMDELEQMSVVGPSEGPKARQVLMAVEELEQRLGGQR